MSIVDDAVSLLAKLDPNIGLDLEVDHGADWEAKLQAALDAITGKPNVKQPQAQDPVIQKIPLLRDILNSSMTTKDVAKDYYVVDVRSLARISGVEHKNVKELDLIKAIRTALV